MSSSAAVNGLVNPRSSGYRCRSRRTFGWLFGTLPLSRSWCATWYAVVLQCCIGLHGSSQSLCIVDHAFLLLWVMSVDSIRVCNALRRSYEMALISSSPSVMVLSVIQLNNLAAAPRVYKGCCFGSNHMISSLGTSKARR